MGFVAVAFFIVGLFIGSYVLASDARQEGYKMGYNRCEQVAKEIYIEIIKGYEAELAAPN